MRRLKLAAPLVAVLGVAVVLVVAGGDDGSAPAPLSIHAEGCQRRVIYHSPQTPGYTAWVGAWEMADGSLMVGFTQATGPVDPSRRDQAPSDLKQKLGTAALGPERDFWGLDLSVEYLRSTDAGRHWTPERSEGFTALYPHGYAVQATLALEDGTLLRRVNGFDLLHDPSLPHTAFLQRLAPGSDTWSKPQVLMDPSRFTYQLSRIRRLRDGRLIATGVYWKAPAGTPQPELFEASADFLLMVSDDEGRSWRTTVPAPPAGSYVAPGEWDTAELPSGDLLAVFRSRKSSGDSTEVRRQGLLKKDGKSWVLQDVRDAPFPHSGHPELLATREGAVLHIATTGIHWTGDGGETWKPLRFTAPRTPYESSYYPRSLQTEDGTVFVFGHRGSDDAYGATDQAVVMDRFRLEEGPPPAGRTRRRAVCGVG